MLQDTIKTLLSTHLIGLDLVLPWARENQKNWHFRGYMIYLIIDQRRIHVFIISSLALKKPH